MNEIVNKWIKDILSHIFNSDGVDELVWERRLSHMPHCFEGVRIMFMNHPWAIQVLVMNIHNPFIHCVKSQCVLKPRDVIMLMHAVTIVAA